MLSNVLPSLERVWESQVAEGAAVFYCPHFFGQPGKSTLLGDGRWWILVLVEPFPDDPGGNIEQLGELGLREAQAELLVLEGFAEHQREFHSLAAPFLVCDSGPIASQQQHRT
jgi:hypothetical protein